MFKRIYTFILTIYKPLSITIFSIFNFIFYFSYELDKKSSSVLLIICILFSSFSIIMDYILVKHLINHKFIKFTKSQYITEIVISIGWLLLLSFLNCVYYSSIIPIVFKYSNMRLIFVFALNIFLLSFYKMFLNFNKNII